MTAANANPILFGLKLYELMTLVGIVVGPIVAVAMTHLAEHLRRDREQKLQVLRTLVATLRLVGDANWTVSMNMLLIEFAGHKKVLQARREYMDAVRIHPTKEQEATVSELTVARQIALVYQVARAMGFKITEGELKTEIYISSGFKARDDLYIQSLLATCELASSARRSAEAAEEMLKRIGHTNNS